VEVVVVNVALNADPPTAKMAIEAAPEVRTWTADQLARFLAFTEEKRLGRTSIATTMNVYSHVLPGMQSQAAEQVSARIFGGGA
jgi:hypothetical protein